MSKASRAAYKAQDKPRDVFFMFKLVKWECLWISFTFYRLSWFLVVRNYKTHFEIDPTFRIYKSGRPKEEPKMVLPKGNK